ncbi:DUF397 domain-containing protein [Streptomyces griseus]|uniref:DUF397 domain-containing protein n=1 Tax=Streptomyces griseus TaxID=1911 RepID=UPI0033A69D7D
MAKPSTVRAGCSSAESGWRKSSYSGHDGDCVEVAELGVAVGIRDSKVPQGDAVSVDRRAMAVFVSALTSGQMAASRR